MTHELPEHVARNRAYWDDLAPGYVEPGRRNWSTDEISWGIWSIPEEAVRLLPDDVSGMDVIELGCGTAYVAAWLARQVATDRVEEARAELAARGLTV